MKKLIWILVIAGIVGVAGYLYVFYKPHRDIVGGEAQLHASADQLIKAYEQDLKIARDTYNDKIVEVEGVVSKVGDYSVTLNELIYCSLDSSQSVNDVKEGAMLKVKGRILSYDDLFGEIKMDNGVILKP